MWRLLAGLGALSLVAFLLILFGNSRYHSGQLAERAIWQAKTAAAQLDDQKHASTVEAAQTAVTQEQTDDLKAKLADALAAARNRPRGLCKPASRGSAVQSVPEAAGAPSGAPGADTAALVDADQADDEACAVAVVKAEGWLDWWTKVSAIER